MFDLAILGLLTEQDLHGYELKKRLADVLGGRSSISFGSLYPALARLEKQGAVKAVEERTEVPSPPMTGSLVGELAAFRARARATAPRVRAGRGKKVYGITDEGRARLAELLTDPDMSDDRAFEVRVALCRHLDVPDRVALFERRRAELVRRRDDTQRRRKGTPSTGTGRLDTYRRALLERTTTSIDHDLAWIDRLLESERQALATEEPS